MLLAHVDSTLVTQGQLDALPTPRRMGTMHQPVPHGALVRSLEHAAMQRGYQVRRKQLALSRHGERLFGVMDLMPPEGVVVGSNHGFSIGFRNSTDETLSIRMVAGVRVFVCDNLALSGDLIALQRRNTVRLELDEAVRAGFDRYEIHASLLNGQIHQLQADTIDDGAASQIIVRLFDGKVLPMRIFPVVVGNYFRPTPEMTDCLPRTKWGLHNAFTRALKKLSPLRRFGMNVALGEAFGLRRDGR